MGKGDKKTVRGKTIMGSYGAKRRKKRTPAYVAPVVKEVKKKAPEVKKEETLIVKEVKKKVPEAKKEETLIVEAPEVVAPKIVAEKAKKPAAKKKAAPKTKEKKEEKSDS